jgi:hypothetical protein
MKMNYRYNLEKNAELLRIRKIGFDEILDEVGNGNLLGIKEHPNPKKYPNQNIMYVKCIETVYMVPFVIEEDGTFFLKTLYPSRKARKIFLLN